MMIGVKFFVNNKISWFVRVRSLELSCGEATSNWWEFNVEQKSKKKKTKKEKKKTRKKSGSRELFGLEMSCWTKQRGENGRRSKGGPVVEMKNGLWGKSLHWKWEIYRVPGRKWRADRENHRAEENEKTHTRKNRPKSGNVHIPMPVLRSFRLICHSQTLLRQHNIYLFNASSLLSYSSSNEFVNEVRNDYSYLLKMGLVCSEWENIAHFEIADKLWM